MKLDQITKAIVGGITAFGGAVATANSDGHMTVTEWALAVATALVAGSAVWAATNAPKEPQA